MGKLFLERTEFRKRSSRFRTSRERGLEWHLIGHLQSNKAQLAVDMLVRVVDSFSSLELLGLMAIPPYHENPEQMRPYFRKLADLLAELNRTRAVPLTELSMGMSRDYQVAIEEGATLIRVGSGIFGPRVALRYPT